MGLTRWFLTLPHKRLIPWYFPQWMIPIVPSKPWCPNENMQCGWVDRMDGKCDFAEMWMYAVHAVEEMRWKYDGCRSSLMQCMVPENIVVIALLLRSLSVFRPVLGPWRCYSKYDCPRNFCFMSWIRSVKLIAHLGGLWHSVDLVP